MKRNLQCVLHILHINLRLSSIKTVVKTRMKGCQSIQLQPDRLSFKFSFHWIPTVGFIGAQPIHSQLLSIQQLLNKGNWCTVCTSDGLMCRKETCPFFPKLPSRLYIHIFAKISITSLTFSFAKKCFLFVLCVLYIKNIKINSRHESQVVFLFPPWLSLLANAAQCLTVAAACSDGGLGDFKGSILEDRIDPQHDNIGVLKRWSNNPFLAFKRESPLQKHTSLFFFNWSCWIRVWEGINLVEFYHVSWQHHFRSLHNTQMHFIGVLPWQPNSIFIYNSGFKFSSKATSCPKKLSSRHS